MDEGRRDKRDRLLEQLLALDPGEQTALLTAVCANNPELRAELEQLLALDQRMHTNFLETPPMVAPLPPLTAGATLGRYVIERLIGAGGMSAVYLARDPVVGRRVAIKVLSAVPHDQAWRDRFFAELKILGSIRHNHVVGVYDFGETAEGLLYLVMEHLDGEDLATAITNGRCAEVACKIDIARQIALALRDLHAAGIVHRDLKPANVMLDQSGRVKLIDFGIARSQRAEGLTRTGLLVGTPEYMPPERLSSTETSPLMDTYSYGVLLFELFSGKRPFTGNTAEVLHRALYEPLPFEWLKGRAPAHIVALIEAATAKDPNERPHDFERVLAALEGRRARRPWIANRRAAAVVATVTVTAVLGTIAFRNNVVRPTLRDSVAVLPFSGPRDDGGVEYIADGLAESVTNSLSRLSGIRVAPRSKAFAYKGKNVSVEDAGRALGVQTIVMGSVARAGSRIRVQAELVDVEAGTQLWGEQFEGDENDLLRMQNALTQMVSQQLTSGTGRAATVRMQAGSTADPKAYQAYLRGRHAQFSLADYPKANAYFREALNIDPNYALAYAGLAISYVDGLPTATMVRAKAAALRALELDPTLAEGHLALGLILGWYEFDWSAAEQSLKRARDLQPNDALTHLYYGWLLLHTGRGNDGIAEGHVAFRLDPLNPYIEMAYAQMHYACGQPQVAIERLRSLLSSSDFKVANWALAYAHLMKAEWQEAIRVLDVFGSAVPDSDFPVAIYQAFAYKQLGDSVRSRQLLNEARRLGELLSAQIPSMAYVRATLAAVGGQRKDALEWLRRAVVEHDSAMPFNLASVDPAFADLRSDPRYLAITTSVTKAGLTPCQAPPDAASASTREAPPSR